MARRRSTTAQEATKADEPTIDTPPIELALPDGCETLEDVVQAGEEIGRAKRGTYVCLSVRQTPSQRLDGLNYPSGLGGQTIYGVFVQTDWRDRNPPFFESLTMEEPMAVCQAMKDDMEVTWRVTRARMQEPDEEEDTLRTERRTRRPRGIGDGLPQRSNSKRKRTAT